MRVERPSAFKDWRQISFGFTARDGPNTLPLHDSLAVTASSRGDEQAERAAQAASLGKQVLQESAS